MTDRSTDTLLDDAKRTLTKLEKLCCRPERSPAMQTIADDLAVADSLFASFAGDERGADEIVTRLEKAGARIGELQVGCCAPARMPLYGDLLTSLMALQRTANARVGRGH